MRYAVPLGAAFLIGLGVCLHRPVEEPVPQGLRSVTSEASPMSGLHSEPYSVGRADRGPEPARPLEKPPASAEAPTQSVRAALAPAPSWAKVLATLEGPLKLTDLTRAGIEAVLRSREDEIKSLYDSLRRAGVVDLHQYEWQVGLLKASWFRRVDGLLDSIQHDRFVELVEKGLFNEGLAFTVEPGMTVLE